MDPIKLRMDLRNNQSDLEGFVNDLDSWSREMKEKEERVQSGATSGVSQPNQSIATDKSISSDVHKLKESGNGFLKRREYQKAVNQYSEAMVLDPEYAVLPANRAMAYLKQANFSAAVRDCDLAISLDRSYVKAYLRRGTAHEHLGKHSLALRDFTTALELEPNNSEAKQAANRIRASMPAKSTAINGKQERSSDKTTAKLETRPTTSTPSTAPADRLDPPLLDIPVKRFDNDTQLNAFIDSVLHSTAGGGDIASGETRSPPVSRDVTNERQTSTNKPSILNENISDVGRSGGTKGKTDRILNSVTNGITEDKTSRVLDSDATNDVTEDKTSRVLDSGATNSVTEDKTSRVLDSGATNGVTEANTGRVLDSGATNGVTEDKSILLNGSATAGSGDAGRDTTTADPTLPSLPPVPTTSYQLLADWRCLSGDERRLSRYLLSIPGQCLPALFSHSLDARLLSGLIQCMPGWSVEEATERLVGLARVPRVDTILLFLESPLRRSLSDTVKRCQRSGMHVGEASRFI